MNNTLMDLLTREFLLTPADKYKTIITEINNLQLTLMIQSTLYLIKHRYSNIVYQPTKITKLPKDFNNLPVDHHRIYTILSQGQICTCCNGSGKIVDQAMVAFGYGNEEKTTCGDCYGYGKYYNNTYLKVYKYTQKVYKIKYHNPCNNKYKALQDYLVEFCKSLNNISNDQIAITADDQKLSTTIESKDYKYILSSYSYYKKEFLCAVFVEHLMTEGHRTSKDCVLDLHEHKLLYLQDPTDFRHCLCKLC